MARVILVDPYRFSKWWHDFRLQFRRRFRARIFSAIEQGDDAAALRLATPGTLQKSVGEFGQSPLVAAISAGNLQLAHEFILRGGAYLGDGSMAHAAMRGYLTIVDALLVANKSPDEPLLEQELTTGYTPLMWAVNRKHLPVVRRLLEAGADVNAVSLNGSNAAMLTAKGDPPSLEALEILCSYKVDISRKDWRGRNLIREARDRERNSGRPELRQIIERHFPGTNVDED
ncbi:ankyrin repeat domain-containing protein [Rhodoferax saidenbachensis]|uniref:Ankyrin repeat protein n=1 Tax=Rhodoferax saidenbachensis TaxID=1484693 RepID=A0ABU1ZQW2_9BURK|nr:ankyrin repeat domain-containing protein [Rhodoferax saidenbachensis]MDR7307940.1 ankyrin repeat protein [Rhodoferax saidenbachensis]